MQIGTTIMENTVDIPQKLTDPPYNSVIQPLEIVPEKVKSAYEGDSCSSIIITNEFTIAKT